MRAFFARSRALLASAKLPFLLCSAPTLPVVRAAVRTEAASDSARPSGRLPSSSAGPLNDGVTVSANAVTGAFRALLSHPQSRTTASSSASHSPYAAIAALSKSKQKDLKRRGFHAIIQWCEVHQSWKATSDGRGVDLADVNAILDMDAAALSWVQAFMPFLSCGQSLVLTGFLCDSLWRLSEMEAALKQSSVGEQVQRRLASLTGDAVCHVGALVHRVNGSDQLERQPLPAIMSAIYGLHRITSPESPLSLDEVTRTTLAPSQAMLFAMLYNVRVSFPLSSSVPEAASASPSSAGESNSGRAKGLADATASESVVPETVKAPSASVKEGNKHLPEGEDSETALATQVLLTFVLVMTPSRREELLSAGDQALFRNVLSQLVHRIRNRLHTRRFLEKEANRLLAKQTAAGDGVHQGGDSAALMTALTGTDQLECVSADSVFVSLHECLAIMRNIHFASPATRVMVLQYLLCILRTPSLLVVNGEADLATLAKIFDTLDTVPRRLRLPLTEYLIASVPVPQDMAVVARFLAHTRSPAKYVARVNLNPERLKNLRADEAAALLRAGLGADDWALTKTLVLAALGDKSPALVSQLVTVDTADGALSASEVRVKELALTPEVVAAMEALLPQSRQTQQSAAPDAAAEERMRWLATLVRTIDWSAGVVLSGSGSRDKLGDLECDESSTHRSSDRDRGATRHTLPALEVYLHTLTTLVPSCSNTTLLTSADKMDDSVLLNKYVRFLFRGDEGVPAQRTLLALTRLVDQLTGSDSPRQLTERVVRYNGVTSLSAMFRFLDILAPYASRFGVEDKDVLNHLLKQSSLDPGKLLSHHTPHARGDRHRLAQPDLASPAYYHRCLRNGMEYVLSCKSCWATASAREETRQVLSRWISHFYRYAATKATETSRGSEVTPKPAGAANAESTNEEAGDEDDALDSASATKAGDAEETVGAVERADSVGIQEEQSDRLTEEEETVEEGGPSSSRTAAVATGTSATGQALTREDVEELLVLALRAGARLPTNAVVEIANQFREQLAQLPAHLDDGVTPCSPALSSDAPADGDTRIEAKRLYVHLPQTAATDALLRAPVECLPTAAQLVALVRGNCGFALPLSNTYLTHLTTTCDTRIFLDVVTAFVSSVRSNRAGPNLVDDLDIAARVMTAFFARVEGGAGTDGTPSDAALFATQAPSEVMAPLVKLLLSHLLHGRRAARQLAEVVRGGAAHRDSGDAANDPPAVAFAEDKTVAGTQVGTTPAAESVEPNRWDEEERLTDAEQQRKEVEDLLMRAVSLLSREQIKNLALSQEDHLQSCFPKLHRYLYLRISHQLGDLTVPELLLLASRFPQSSKAVSDQLTKQDIALTVDFNEFLRVARKLPMELTEVIVTAHLPSLTFAWCTRLLSTMAPRHEELPLPLLRAILKRVEDLVESSTADSDRNLLLMVLQGYLNFEGVSDGASTACDVEESREAMPANDGNEAAHALTAEEESTSLEEVSGEAQTVSPRRAVTTLHPPEAIQRRREAVLHTCDRLLQVEAIEDLASLQDFLAVYPASLQSVTDAAVMRRAESVVLRALLKRVNSASPPIAEIRLYAVMMLKHHLLSSSACRLIMNQLFANPSAWEVLLSASAAGSLRTEAGDLVSQEHLLTLSVELAIVLGVVQQGGAAPGGTGMHMTMSDALETVCGRFESASQQLLILSLLADAAGNYRRGMQVHQYSGGTAAVASFTPIEQQHAVVVDRVCQSLMLSADQLTASEFSRLVQNISRLRKWPVVRERLSVDGEAAAQFQEVFAAAFRRADAHSRCVVAKALATDAELFAQHEHVMMGLLRDDIAVLSSEDIELLLVAALQMSSSEQVEQTLDAIGTKLLSNLQQCKRSTLVRLLQCHAAFNVHDKVLLEKSFAALEEQCCKAGSSDMKLDVAQVLTILHAASALGLRISERLLTLCFGRLERVAEQLSFAQLAQACGLAVDLEMGYSQSIQTLVTRLLDSREGLRHGHVFRAVIERVCDEYDVEAPQQLRQLRLRSRRERDRLEAYWRARRSQEALVE